MIWWILTIIHILSIPIVMLIFKKYKDNLIVNSDYIFLSLLPIINILSLLIAWTTTNTTNIKTKSNCGCCKYDRYITNDRKRKCRLLDMEFLSNECLCNGRLFENQ